MRVCRGSVLLALLQSFAVLAHNNHNNTGRNVEKIASNSILHKLWKRESPCPIGEEYSSEDRCCKLCNPGTYAKSDCTEEHGLPDCRSCTEGSTYMDHKNGLRQCHKCLQCDAESGQETLGDCIVQRNTVCKCAKDFFCAENRSIESHECIKCQHCTSCEHYSEPCTVTRDAVCKSSRNNNISFALLGVFVVFSSCFILWLWCRTNTNPHPQFEPQPSTVLDELKDIDLNEYLWKFSEKMNFDAVLYVLRRMQFPEPRIDAILRDYSNHSEEQKYQLLKEWYERHGKSGAFKELISTLQINRREVAEQLIQIVKSDREQS